MQYFVEKINGVRVPIDKLTCDVLLFKGYQRIIATTMMTVVRHRNALKKRKSEQRLRYGGGGKTDAFYDNIKGKRSTTTWEVGRKTGSRPK